MRKMLNLHKHPKLQIVYLKKKQKKKKKINNIFGKCNLQSLIQLPDSTQEKKNHLYQYFIP